MEVRKVSLINSLGFKGTVGLLAIALGILAGVVYVVSTDGKRLVLAESAQKMEQIVNTAVEDLNTRSQEIAALVRSLASVAEVLPKNVETFMHTLPPVVDFDGDQKVAGGGYWPEPGHFEKGVVRRSFFWGREDNGEFKYYDDYNGEGVAYDEARFDSDEAFRDEFLASPGYHNEEWYVVVRYTRPGTCIWSSSYMDPYSFQPMVTCTVGTYDDKDQLTGTFTIDLKLEGIEDDVRQWERKTGGYLAIFDRNGKFLAFPRAGEVVKNISQDDEGNKVEEFKSASEFAQQQVMFRPIADAIREMNEDILRSASAMPNFDPGLADKLNRDSYQIDTENAEFLAAVVADPMAERTRETFLYKTIQISNDFLLQEPSLVFVFHVPDSYWKYVLVKPLSEATAVATNLSDTLLFKISVLILAVISVAYLILRFTLVRRLSDTAGKVQIMGNLVADGKVSELRTATIDNTGGDEIGLLANVVNRISVGFADKHEEVEEMNRTLEHKVEERTQQLARKTRDIQTMLENMHQGVFTILDDNQIHPEYAAHLETILETSAIAGASFMQLIFENTDLSADIKNQIGTGVGAMMGADAMMFDMNRHLLVSEVNFTAPSGTVKVLELDWDPITNELDEIEKMMVTVRDVTQLRGLQEEARHQKRELEIIGQLLAVSQEKFHGFVESSHRFLEENRRLLTANPEKNLDIVPDLFRNMHTIKGNARTFGLLHLTGLVHEAESEYDDLRKHPEHEWRSDHMLKILDQVKTLVDEYDHINEHKLGRKGAGRRGDAARYLMVEQEKLAQKIKTLEAVDNSDIGSLRQACNQVLQELRLIGTDTIQDVLGPVLESVQELARELKKPEPSVYISDNGIHLKNQIVALLRNTFMHVFRNSLDHGLESAADRERVGKPEAGTIHLELTLNPQMLSFRFWDDGRGLWLTKIKEKAVQAEVIPASAQLSDQDVANLVFHSGLSTAREVTEVSGRGVGMDAVKKFIEREEGTIELNLLSGKRLHPEYCPFEFIIRVPAKFAVRKVDV